jgi:broad specificity phosphatase PhoE
MRRRALTAGLLVTGLLVAGLVVTGLASKHAAAAAPDLWALLQGGGQIVLMRHGVTFPETSEPPGARVDDCSTQRNLSEAGREEARKVGAAFRAHGIPVGKVLASRWCRCLETARLAFGRVEPWPDLEFAGFSDSPEKRRREGALRKAASKRPEQGNTILVTHGFVIQAILQESAGTAEFFVLTPQADGTFRLAGSLRPADL